MKAVSEHSEKVTGSTPLWTASRLLLTEQGTDFFARWSKVAKSFDEEEIHDLRVASRRLREGLALFAPCFPVQERKRLAKKVKKVTRMLGEMRNTDEAVNFFAGLSDKESEGAREDVQGLLAALGHERELTHQKLETRFGNFDPTPLKDDFRVIRADGNLFTSVAADPLMELVSFAGEAIISRAHAVGELLPHALEEDNGAAQHQLRIAIKKLRYRLELLSPLIGNGYEELHGTLKDYQDVLGKLHDVDVFVEIVQERAVDGEGKQALLRVMSVRRRSLFSSFQDLLERAPLARVGERAMDGLRAETGE